MKKLKKALRPNRNNHTVKLVVQQLLINSHGQKVNETECEKWRLVIFN